MMQATVEDEIEIKEVRIYFQDTVRVVLERLRFTSSHFLVDMPGRRFQDEGAWFP
jgi:hypothetical protein